MAEPVVYEGMVISSPGKPDLVRRGKQWIPVDAAGAAGNMAPQEEIQLKEARAASENALEVLGDLTRFQDINTRRPTGGPINNTVNWLLGKTGNPDIQQMEEIKSRIAPQQRAPGSGTTSDTDLKLYLNASPETTKATAANLAIIERGRREAVRRQQYADFLDDYSKKNGTLSGAQAAFRGMVGLGSQENPYSIQQAGDRSRLPRGAYYQSPDGIRRNDNGPRGNPIIAEAKRTGGQAKRAVAPVRVSSPEEAKNLAPGTRFINPQGQEFVR